MENNIGSGINCSNIFIVKKILKDFKNKKFKIGKKVKLNLLRIGRDMILDML